MVEAIEKTAIMVALTDHQVAAEVIDLDHYRIRGGMAVETDYIIKVKPKEASTILFEKFTLSKTYSSFRTLAQQLKNISDREMSCITNDHHVDDATKKLAQYCETVHHLVETQRLQYLGKVERRFVFWRLFVCLFVCLLILESEVVIAFFLFYFFDILFYKILFLSFSGYKVNYNYVKVLAKKRSLIIQEILDATLNHFPRTLEGKPFNVEVAQTIETFFLCDHCNELDNTPSNHSKNYSKEFIDDDNSSRGSSTRNFSRAVTGGGLGLTNPIEDAVQNVGKFLKKTLSSKDENKSRDGMTISTSATSTPVVPITRKTRKSVVLRQVDDDELKQVGEEANLLMDDERPHTELLPSYSHPVPNFSSYGTKIGDSLENNPIIFMLIAVAVIVFLKGAGNLAVTLDFDILLLLLWAAFCVGLHTPRPMISGIDKYFGPPPSTPRAAKAPVMKSRDQDGRKLLRMSMVSTPDTRKTIRDFEAIRDEDEEDEIMAVNQSPLPRFPEGAALGSEVNCWSEPDASNFHVRGPNYLKDKVKIESADFVFPVRGVDLFLTDTCPENAGANAGVMGGQLRDVPTFIVNFRLPWGVLLSYFEIPEMFVPFVKAG
jgi:hypothetical protein